MARNFEEYINENLDKRILNTLSSGELSHVKNCLIILDNQVNKDIPSHDDFINAIARRDFYEALKCADNTNIICLPLYGKFIYSHAPIAFTPPLEEGKEKGQVKKHTIDPPAPLPPSPTSIDNEDDWKQSYLELHDYVDQLRKPLITDDEIIKASIASARQAHLDKCAFFNYSKLNTTVSRVLSIEMAKQSYVDGVVQNKVTIAKWQDTVTHLINATPSGALRNAFCDLNLEMLAYLIRPKERDGILKAQKVGDGHDEFDVLK